MQWYLKVISQYAELNGRARRKEYWMFFLFNFLFAFGAGFTVGLLHLPTAIAHLYSLAVFIPSLAVAVRRIHDTGHSGWWLFCPIYNFVLLVTDGESKDNRFGPSPKVTPTPPMSMNRAA